jgi:ATP-dependent RNA helicase RhlB
MVEIAPDQVTADRVRQICYMVGNDEKIPLLIGLLRSFAEPRIMVFVNTKREGERVWGYLEGNGFKPAMLSGDVPQKKRLSLLKQFQAGELPVMVATDVAARGLHIPGVTHVINYDLPEDAEDYVHRIGRTARAGEAGDAISFVCETYAFCLPDIEKYIGAKIEVGAIEPGMLAEVDPKSRVRVPRRPRDDRGGGGRGRRGPPRGDKPREHGERTADSSGDGQKKPRRRRRKPAAGSAPAG